jgi:hypothetical protein
MKTIPMKKLVIVALMATCSVSVVAQGTVVFNNRIVGTIVTHVYGGGETLFHGNSANDTPAGSANYSGLTLLAGPNFLAQLLSANGANQPESSLQAASSAPTTFRTGAAAGFVNGITAILSNVPADSPVATLEMVAWDNSSGLYPTWALASTAWQAGLVGAGRSGTFNVSAIGASPTAGLNPAPTLDNLTSFNIFPFFPIIPEPTSFALTALGGATALFIFRRRK